MMYRYDNYTDSFVRIDGEPNTGSTTVRTAVPLKEAVIVKKVELTDDCINEIADAVVRKMADRKTENSSEKPNNCEPQTEDFQDWKDRMWAEAVVTEPKWTCERCGCENHADFKWCFHCGFHKPERSEG